MTSKKVNSKKESQISSTFIYSLTVQTVLRTFSTLKNYSTNSFSPPAHYHPHLPPFHESFQHVIEFLFSSLFSLILLIFYFFSFSFSYRKFAVEHKNWIKNFLLSFRTKKPHTKWNTFLLFFLICTSFQNTKRLLVDSVFSSFFSILSKFFLLIKKHMKNICRSRNRGGIRLGGRSMTSRPIGSHLPCCGRWRLQLCSGRCNRINWIVVVVSGNVVNFVNISLWWKIAEAVRARKVWNAMLSKLCDEFNSISRPFPPCINILLKFYMFYFFLWEWQKNK